MEFHLKKKINISDKIIEDYRNAVGLLPEMKTDEKWLDTVFLETFDMEADEVFTLYNTEYIERELSYQISYITDQYRALGGGHFE